MPAIHIFEYCGPHKLFKSPWLTLILLLIYKRIKASELLVLYTVLNKFLVIWRFLSKLPQLLVLLCWHQRISINANPTLIRVKWNKLLPFCKSLVWPGRGRTSEPTHQRYIRNCDIQTKLQMFNCLFKNTQVVSTAYSEFKLYIIFLRPVSGSFTVSYYS